MSSINMVGNENKTILFDLDGAPLPMDQDELTKGYFVLLIEKLVPYGYEPEKLVDAFGQVRQQW